MKLLLGTTVEIIVRDCQLLANDVKVLDTGIAADTVVSVVFKPNIVICSNKDMLSAVLMVSCPRNSLRSKSLSGETAICENAFASCHITRTQLTL